MSHPYQGNDGTQGNEGTPGEGGASGTGGWQPAEPQGEPTYGQSGATYEQGGAPSYGSPNAAYGQASPTYGQASAPSYGTPNAAYGQPAGGYPAPGSGYGEYQAPVKRKGLKRIIFGIVAIVLGGLGMVAGIFLGAVLGLLFSLSSIGDSATALGAGGQVSVTTGAYVVAVPASEGASCTTTGDPASAVSTNPQPGGLTFTSNGNEYTVVDMVSVSSDARLSVSCTGTENAVIAPLSAGGVVGGLLLGVGIPALLTLIGLILLIWGIVARVRSGRSATRA